MSRFGFQLLLALCIAFFISSAHAGTIDRQSSSLDLSARDHEHEPQAQPQEPTSTTENDAPDTSPPVDGVSGQDHNDFPFFANPTVVANQPTPSPELIRLGPSPENIGAGVGSEKETPANRQGAKSDDEEGAAGSLRMNLVGVGLATTCIIGWLL